VVQTAATPAGRGDSATVATMAPIEATTDENTVDLRTGTHQVYHTPPAPPGSIRKPDSSLYDMLRFPSGHLYLQLRVPPHSLTHVWNPQLRLWVLLPSKPVDNSKQADSGRQHETFAELGKQTLKALRRVQQEVKDVRQEVDKLEEKFGKLAESNKETLDQVLETKRLLDATNKG